MCCYWVALSYRVLCCRRANGRHDIYPSVAYLRTQQQAETVWGLWWIVLIILCACVDILIFISIKNFFDSDSLLFFLLLYLGVDVPEWWWDILLVRWADTGVSFSCSKWTKVTKYTNDGTVRVLNFSSQCFFTYGRDVSRISDIVQARGSRFTAKTFRRHHARTTKLDPFEFWNKIRFFVVVFFLLLHIMK